MKRNLKKQIKDLMGVLNPISDYRYQYEQHGDTFNLYYLDADKEQRTIGENFTADQMVAVLSVLNEKHDCDIPFSWKYMHLYYDKRLTDSGLRIRSLLCNLVHDEGTIRFKSFPRVMLRVGVSCSLRPLVREIKWSERYNSPVVVDAANGDEYSIECLYDTDCANLLQNIVHQRLIVIK